MGGWRVCVCALCVCLYSEVFDILISACQPSKDFAYIFQEREVRFKLFLGRLLVKGLHAFKC